MATTTKNAATNAVKSSESVGALVFDYSAAAPKSVTLTGEGNKTLSGSSDARDLFVGGTGRNTIIGYGSEDTIQFVVRSSSIITDTDDVQLNGDGGAVLVVKNGKGKVLGISSSATAAPTYAYYGGSYNGTQQKVIQDFMAVLDNTSLSGTEALDEAVNSVSGGTYKTMDALISKATLDCSTIKSADTFLRDYCGIILNNADTGAIVGWDAGGGEVKTAPVSEYGHTEIFIDTKSKAEHSPLTSLNKLLSR